MKNAINRIGHTILYWDHSPRSSLQLRDVHEAIIIMAWDISDDFWEVATTEQLFLSYCTSKDGPLASLFIVPLRCRITLLLAQPENVCVVTCAAHSPTDSLLHSTNDCGETLIDFILRYAPCETVSVASMHPTNPSLSS